MGDYEHELELEEKDAAALAHAEEFILNIARTRHPQSLRDLRSELAHGADDIDPAVLRVAFWSLLNEDRLQLTSDRTLRVSG